jgi:hypothetical protein
MKMVARSLEDIAAAFDRQAEASKSASDRAKTQRTKVECLAAYRAYRDAAQFVRNTEIVPQ